MSDNTLQVLHAMAALCKLLCLISIFTFIQVCLSYPLIAKFSFQQPQAGSLTPGQVPQVQYPFLNKMAQVRAKLMAMMQKKMAEFNILMSTFSPNGTNLITTPQLAPGQPVPPMQLPQIPGLSQLAGSLQSILPALQSAAMNPPVLPQAQPAPGQPVAGVPTVPGQPIGQPGVTPVATPAVQPPVQTPVPAPVTPQVQAQTQPVANPLAQPAANPIQQVSQQPRNLINPLAWP